MGLFGTTVKDIQKWEREKKVDKIANALNNKNIEVRKSAIAAFGNLRVVNGVPLLIPNLNNDDHSVRKLTENAILKIGDVAINDLYKAKWQIIDLIDKSLVMNTGKLIIGYTEAQINMYGDEIRAIISKYRGDKSQKIEKNEFNFIPVSYSSSEYNRLEDLFNRIPDKIRQVEKLIPLVNDQYRNLTHSIDSLTGRFEILKNNAKVKEIDSNLLYDFAESNDLVILLNIFEKVENEGQRTKIFQAICNNYNYQLSNIILNALKDKNAEIRALAVKTLEKLDKINIVDILIIVLNDIDSKVRKEAEILLGKIDDINTLLNIFGNAENKNQNSRFTIFQKLCLRYNSQLSQIILQALKDKNYEIRALAVRTLEKLNNKDTFDHLMMALKDQESSVRTEAAIAFGKLKDIRAIDPLLLAIDKEPYSAINRNIICSLISLGHNLDISAYIEDLNNTSYEKRTNAASLIIEIAKWDFSLVRNQWNSLVARIEKPNINRREGPSQSWSNDCGGHNDQSVHRDSPGIGLVIPVELKNVR